MGLFTGDDKFYEVIKLPITKLAGLHQSSRMSLYSPPSHDGNNINSTRSINADADVV